MLSDESKRILLTIARQTVEAAASNRRIIPLEISSLPAEVQENGACFVTLTRHGMLRGCIGSLEARQPLALDVQEHAMDAALNDYRFSPLVESELNGLSIEISVLTPPIPLPYASAAELPAKLNPGKDGVILSRGLRRATFLPQVWEKVPDPPTFLSMLCEKMGAEADLWRREKLNVFTYEVISFEESGDR